MEFVERMSFRGAWGSSWGFVRSFCMNSSTWQTVDNNERAGLLLFLALSSKAAASSQLARGKNFTQPQ